MGLEQLAEVLLDQPLPRLTPSEDYVLLDALGDKRRRRLAWARDWQLSGFRRPDGCAFRRFSGHHVPDWA
jgi:hypothetical protein